MVRHRYICNIVKTNFKKHLFRSINMTYHVNPTKLGGVHEFVLTILPLSLFNTLMDLSYSVFVSKLFISNDCLILRLCMLDNFPSVFWVQPNKPPMTILGMFSCTWRFPFYCHAMFLVLNWSSEHTFFCFSNVFSPTITTYS